MRKRRTSIVSNALPGNAPNWVSPYIYRTNSGSSIYSKKGIEALWGKVGKTIDVVEGTNVLESRKGFGLIYRQHGH